MSHTKHILTALTLAASLAACMVGDEDFETSDALEEALAEADQASELPPEVIAGGWVDDWSHGSVGYLQQSDGFVFCSGQKISPTVFLTAAHCTEYIRQIGIQNVFVGYGPVSRQIRVPALAAASHPAYDGAVTSPFDIGVVAMAAPINGVPTARIAKPRLGEFVMVLGYGRNDNGVPFLRKAGITRIVSHLATGGWELAGPLARTCRGDSGGAAMRLGAPNQLLLITSYGPASGCNTSGRTGHVDPNRNGNRQFLEYVGATFL